MSRQENIQSGGEILPSTYKNPKQAQNKEMIVHDVSSAVFARKQETRQNCSQPTTTFCYLRGRR